MLAQMLDIRTLSLMTGLFSGVCGLGLIFFYRAQPRFRGLNLIGLGNLFLGLGFTLITIRYYVPTLFSIIVANLAIVSAFALIFTGVLRFRNLARKLGWTNVILLVLFLPVMAYFTYVESSVSARIQLVSGVLAIQSLLCASIIMYGVEKALHNASLFTAFPFLGFACFLVFRSIWAAGEIIPENSFLSAGVVHGLAFVSVSLVITMSSFGFMWIASSRLQSELRDQARIDPLTKVYNRRALEELGASELSRSTRHSLAVSVIILDIDHFKSVNDTHGHLVGDRVIASVAAVLTTNLRQHDIAARYGGEEFVLLLPSTSLDNASDMAEKLRGNIEQQVFNVELTPLKITASFGVATRQSDDEGWEEFFSRADKALYRAKRSGRNRVESDSQAPDGEQSGG